MIAATSTTTKTSQPHGKDAGAVVFGARVVVVLLGVEVVVVDSVVLVVVVEVVVVEVEVVVVGSEVDVEVVGTVELPGCAAAGTTCTAMAIGRGAASARTRASTTVGRCIRRAISLTNQ
jgi:hypothetical protein